MTRCWTFLAVGLVVSVCLAVLVLIPTFNSDVSTTTRGPDDAPRVEPSASVCSQPKKAKDAAPDIIPIQWIVAKDAVQDVIPIQWIVVNNATSNAEYASLLRQHFDSAKPLEIFPLKNAVFDEKMLAIFGLILTSHPEIKELYIRESSLIDGFGRIFKSVMFDNLKRIKLQRNELNLAQLQQIVDLLPPQLEHFEFEGFGSYRSDGQRIKINFSRFSSLRTFVFVNAKDQNVDFEFMFETLTCWDTLIMLDLRDNQLTDLSWMQRLNNDLRVLNLNGNRISTEIISTLIAKNSFLKLEEFSICNNNLSRLKGLTQLFTKERFPKLKSLHLSQENDNGETDGNVFQFVANFAFTHLSLGFPSHKISGDLLELLSGQINLQELQLVGLCDECDPSDWSKPLNQLRKLSINARLISCSNKNVFISELEDLTIQCDPMLMETITFLEYIQKYKKLKKLTILGKNLNACQTNILANYIGNLSSLESLRLGFSITNTNFFKAFFHKNDRCTIEELWLDDIQLSKLLPVSSLYENLAKFPNLRYLHLSLDSATPIENEIELTAPINTRLLTLQTKNLASNYSDTVFKHVLFFPNLLAINLSNSSAVRFPITCHNFLIELLSNKVRDGNFSVFDDDYLKMKEFFISFATCNSEFAQWLVSRSDLLCPVISVFFKSEEWFDLLLMIAKYSWSDFFESLSLCLKDKSLNLAAFINIIIFHKTFGIDFAVLQRKDCVENFVAAANVLCEYEQKSMPVDKKSATLASLNTADRLGTRIASVLKLSSKLFDDEQELFSDNKKETSIDNLNDADSWATNVVTFLTRTEEIMLIDEVDAITALLSYNDIPFNPKELGLIIKQFKLLTQDYPTISTLEFMHLFVRIFWIPAHLDQNIAQRPVWTYEDIELVIDSYRIFFGNCTADLVEYLYAGSLSSYIILFITTILGKPFDWKLFREHIKTSQRRSMIATGIRISLQETRLNEEIFANFRRFMDPKSPFLIDALNFPIKRVKSCPWFSESCKQDSDDTNEESGRS